MPGANERRSDTEVFSGMRKLIRPILSVRNRGRDPSSSGDALTHALHANTSTPNPSTHAEAFYFQKQIQQQTEMTLVLEDGEELQGLLEWYDRCSIKIRAGKQRVLVYKTAIKYMYKTSDAHAPGGVMK